MNFSIEIDGDGWTATRDGLDGLASLINGRDVYFEVMADVPGMVKTRRGGGSWELWPDLFERSTNSDFPNCWQIVAGVTLPT